MNSATRIACIALVFAGLPLATGPARAAGVGAILGFNRCGISGDVPEGTAYGPGFGLVAGIQGEFGIARDMWLSLQPTYVQRRTRVTSVDAASGSGESLLDLSLDYVSVPVVVKVGAGGGRTYVSGGLDLAFLTSARASGQGIDQDVKDWFESADVSALVGLGVVFPVGSPHLTAELRYVQGLVNLAGGGSPGTVQGLANRFHSGGLMLAAGILFPLGKP